MEPESVAALALCTRWRWCGRFALVQRTFFAHFCAGTDSVSIRPTLDRLRSRGVGGILDYAAEKDLDAVEDADARDLGVDRNVLAARTYDYLDEAECDENMRITLHSIDAAEREQGFAAVKMTSLGKPELLQHISQVLYENEEYFHHYFDSVADKTATGAPVTREQFMEGLRRRGVPLSEHQMHDLFARIDVNRDGEVDMLEWMDYLSIHVLATQPVEEDDASPILRANARTVLDATQRERLRNMERRAETLARAAKEKGVTIMIDAEQTYLQPAIDHVVLSMQQQYNHDRPVVFNTYQAYLKNASERVALGLRKAMRDNFKFGAKIVRGAYMVQERKRAQAMGYEDPVQPTKDATNQSYDECWARVLTSIAEGSEAEVMIASHNEDSIRRVTGRMKELGIGRDSRSVTFGQLLGMCDHVSFTLGYVGFQVFKYVPYGPLNDVMPYLIRRAQENSDILGAAVKEQRLMREELLRRFGVTINQQ